MLNRRTLIFFIAVMTIFASVGGAWARPYNTFLWRTSDWEWYYYPYEYRMDDVYYDNASGVGGQWMIVSKPLSLDIVGDEVEYKNSRYKNTTSLRSRGNAFANIRNLEYVWNPLEFQGNFVNSLDYTSRDHVYTMQDGIHARATVNGDPLYGDMKLPNAPGILPQQNVRYIFMVIPSFNQSMEMNFGTMDNYWLYDDTYAADIRFAENFYQPTKDILGPIYDKPSIGDYYNRFRFDISKLMPGTYDTQRTYASFMLNPTNAPSQSHNVPVVISNVAYGTAALEPLEFRVALREVIRTKDEKGDPIDSRGDIVAYDHFKWDMTSDHVFGSNTLTSSSNNDWIFVPVASKSDIGNSGIYSEGSDRWYEMVADIRNFCGIRYALQRYDDTTNAGQISDLYYAVEPTLYYLDLPSDVRDIDTDGGHDFDKERLFEVPLDPLSHIAPGLVTRYVQNYKTLAANQTIFGIYPVDTSRWEAGPKYLRLSHVNRLIYGASVGRAASTSKAEGTDQRQYKVEGFFLGYSNSEFLKVNAPELDWHNEVDKLEMVDPDKGENEKNIISDTSVTPDFVTGTAVRTVKVDADIPERLRYNEETNRTVGLLPLHITFNLPRSTNQYVNENWQRLLDLWKTDLSGSAFRDAFAKAFSIHARTPNGTDFDVTAYLKQQGLYDENVKVVMDEANECITVSFISILVDSKETWMGMLEDSSQSGLGTRKFLAFRDGDYYGETAEETVESESVSAKAERSNKWTMTFYVQSQGYQSSGNADNAVNGGSGSAGGSGGGCAAGASVLVGIAALAVCITRKASRSDA